jgi:hypothetical protein
MRLNQLSFPLIDHKSVIKVHFRFYLNAETKKERRKLKFAPCISPHTKIGEFAMSDSEGHLIAGNFERSNVSFIHSYLIKIYTF